MIAGVAGVLVTAKGLRSPCLFFCAMVYAIPNNAAFTHKFDAGSTHFFRALLEMLRGEVEAWCNGTNAICVLSTAVAS
jgi:hypothetical protein